MSYYFAVIGTKDNPLFEHEFGTSKQGGDGIARFRDEARHMNQFIVHSSLDIVEEVQWGSGQIVTRLMVDGGRVNRYLKTIDRYHNNHISCYLTAGNVKFLLLLSPDTHPAAYTASSNTQRPFSAALARQTSSSLAANPTAPQTEEAIRLFFTEVYDAWVKNLMNPFYMLNAPVRSPVFRGRVMAAGKKYL
ncbi:TRAPP subunit [Cryomyces antarcticus]|uniref:TRAPP subunit n=1 Tax=Cryomyces antarcticus TaxID=329879 RepID=A0ABR0LSB7_9PEZI|nr:TRAPP subunit [Cryomyces antarcticus]KAK5020148.1 TRAPP subunit [Cryomyces antarcticus]KAK5201819.1 TRAPP subunit [Cryomyces antarcticus]